MAKHLWQVSEFTLSFSLSRFQQQTSQCKSLFYFPELAKHSVRPNEITHVVCTHGHSDHIGCNYLFLNAVEHIVGRAISNKNVYRVIEDDSEYTIDEGIYVTPTPGHTLDSVSLIVENSNLSAKPVAVCGDLFENRDDCFHELIWIGAGSESMDQQRKNRLLIAEMAGIIIPGHGPQFEVTDEIIDKLTET